MCGQRGVELRARRVSGGELCARLERWWVSQWWLICERHCNCCDKQSVFQKEMYRYVRPNRERERECVCVCVWL